MHPSQGLSRVETDSIVFVSVTQVRHEGDIHDVTQSIQNERGFGLTAVEVLDVDRQKTTQECDTGSIGDFDRVDRYERIAVFHVGDVVTHRFLSLLGQKTRMLHISHGNITQ